MELYSHALTIMNAIRVDTLRAFNEGFAGQREDLAEIKSDASIVTAADRNAERMLRDYVAQHLPTHGVIGEEFYEERRDSDIQWIVDPIDGTQNFFHGIPTWGTILGIHERGKPVVAFVDHPALGVRLHAVRGEGTFWNGERVRLPQTSTAKNGKLDPNTIIGLSTRGMFSRCGDEAVFDALVRYHPSHRIYFDVYATSLAVGGRMGAMAEYGVTTWDIAATELLVTEAGGVYMPTGEVSREKEGLPPRLSAVFGTKHVVDMLMPVVQGC